MIRGTVYVLRQEEGYTVKYSLSTREIQRAEPEGFPKEELILRIGLAAGALLSRIAR